MSEIAGTSSEAPTEHPPLDLLVTLAMSPMEVIGDFSNGCGKKLWARTHIVVDQEEVGGIKKKKNRDWQETQFVPTHLAVKS